MKYTTRDRLSYNKISRIWEVVKAYKEDYYLVCVDNGSGQDNLVGSNRSFVYNFLENPFHFTYLGNFSKVDKFLELYDLMNS